MAREAVSHRSARALKVLEALDRAMPEANIELDYQSPLGLVASVVLSAQTTDKAVNKVTPALLERFPTPAAFARATPEQVEPYIKTLGLFRNKAKSLVALGKAIEERHGGEVPLRREALAALPGVGNKTAGVVSMHLPGGDTAFPVDTHILRLSVRLGFSTETTPDKVEADMRRLVPEPWWFKGHQLLIWHGRRVCDARAPRCEACVVAELCPKKGVKAKKRK